MPGKYDRIYNRVERESWENIIMSSIRGRAALLRSPSMKRGSGDPAHTLLLLQSPAYTSGNYTCHVCWEKGSGPVYHCPDCQFDVHVACTGSGVGTTHFSHFEHPLLPRATFSSSDEVVCDCCGEIQHGSSVVVYRCNQCDFDLCTLCVRAPRCLFHISHPHVLILRSPDEDIRRAWQCNGCGEAGGGMMYHCATCNFDLHTSCARLPLSPSHIWHGDHPLTLRFSSSSSYTCDACGHQGRRWAYECSLCGFHLHPRCGAMPHELPRSSSLNGGLGLGLGSFSRMESTVPQRASSHAFHHHHHHHLLHHNPARPSLRSSPSLLNRSFSSPHHAFDDLPYSSSFSPLGAVRGGLWNHGDQMSSTVLANALSQRLTPTSSHDADALDRIMDMLRSGAVSPSFP